MEEWRDRGREGQRNERMVEERNGRGTEEQKKEAPEGVSRYVGHCHMVSRTFGCLVPSTLLDKSPKHRRTCKSKFFCLGIRSERQIYLY